MNSAGNDRDGNDTGNSALDTNECKVKDESSIQIALNSNENILNTRISIETVDNKEKNSWVI